jgi:hypothetical protein
MRLAEFRIQTLLDEANFFGCFFELTERAERLGLLIDFLLQGSRQALIRGDDVET